MHGPINIRLHKYCCFCIFLNIGNIVVGCNTSIGNCYWGFKLFIVCSVQTYKNNRENTLLTHFFLQSATTYIKFWLAQTLSSNHLYPVLFSSSCVHLCSLYLPKRVPVPNSSIFVPLTNLGRPQIICPAFLHRAFLASTFLEWDSWSHDKPPKWRTRICLGLSPLDRLPSPRLRTPI